MRTRFQTVAFMALCVAAWLGGCSTEDEEPTTPSATSSSPSPPPVNDVEPPQRPTAEVRMGGESAPVEPTKSTEVKPIAPENGAGAEEKPGGNLTLPNLKFDKDEPPSSDAPTTGDATAETPKKDERVAEFGGLQAPKPATWISHPPQSKDRLANYTVPGREGSEAAHLVVFFFGAGQGGSKEANIQRWTGQFLTADDKPVEPKIEEFQADNMPVTMVELAGKYRNQGAGWYTDNQMLLGAIIERSSGNIFIRFVGDAATVDANREPFKEMLKGLHVVEPEK